MTTKRTKSCVYEHFALTMDKKHFVCQSKEEDGTPCGAKISANFGTTDRAAPRDAERGGQGGHCQGARPARGPGWPDQVNYFTIHCLLR